MDVEEGSEELKKRRRVGRGKSLCISSCFSVMIKVESESSESSR